MRRKHIAQRRLNEAQLDQQKAALAAIDIQEKQLRAQIHAAEAQVALASDNLRYTRILSPADGLVGQRQVRLGQFVNVGTQVIAVLPLPNIWALANFKETQMTGIRVGQPARVTVDAFPDLKLTGHVDSWSPGTGSTFALLPPDNATGNFTKVVQRVPVKIVLDNNPSLGALVQAGHVGRSHGRYGRGPCAERRNGDERARLSHDRHPCPARFAQARTSAPRRRSPQPAWPPMRRGGYRRGSAPICSGLTSASWAS